MVPGAEGAVRLSAIDQEGVAVAHDLAHTADDVDVLAVIAQPGVVESAGIAFVLPVSVVKRIAAAKVGKDGALMDDTAVITGGYEIFAQFKAIAVTGVGIAVLMSIGRTSPPAVGIGVHIPNVTHALIQRIDVCDQVVQNLRMDSARFNDRAFGITDGTEEPVRRRIRRSSVGHRVGSIGRICRRF